MRKTIARSDAFPALLPCRLGLSLQALCPRAWWPSLRRARFQVRLDRHELEAVMNARIPRRAVLGLGPVTLASCAKREPYFGKSFPPRSQTLIYNLGAEPGTLDPATSLVGMEAYVFPALF